MAPGSCKSTVNNAPGVATCNFLTFLSKAQRRDKTTYNHQVVPQAGESGSCCSMWRHSLASHNTRDGPASRHRYEQDLPYAGWSPAPLAAASDMN